MNEQKNLSRLIFRIGIYILCSVGFIIVVVVLGFRKDEYYVEVKFEQSPDFQSNSILLLRPVQNIRLSDEGVATGDFQAKVMSDQIDTVLLIIRSKAEQEEYHQGNGYAVQKASATGSIASGDPGFVDGTFKLGSVKYPVEGIVHYKYRIESQNQIIDNGDITASVFQFSDKTINILEKLSILVGLVISLVEMIMALTRLAPKGST
jgi:hypothetical protein